MVCRALILLLTSLILSTASAQSINYSEEAKASQWIDSVMSDLSLRDKVAQLIFIRVGYEKPDSIVNLIQDIKPGGVIIYAGEPFSHAQALNDFQDASELPLLVSIDAEWGLAMRQDSTIRFPYLMALGAIQDNSMIYQMGREIARQCRRMGVHINFAPVVDVNNNPANPVINFRSFGENPEKVAEKAWAYASGLQDGGVIPTAKHFPGHGDTEVDSHQDLPVLAMNRERLDSIELLPFRYVIDKGINGIMTAHLNVTALDDRPNRPSSLSKKITNDLLREEMGFQGLVFTDGLEMQGIAKHFNSAEAAVEAFDAGNDILLLPENAWEAVEGLLNAFQRKVLSEKELDSRVRKILRTKYSFGLHQKRIVDLENLTNELNSKQAILLQRNLTAKSLTLVQDPDSVLPIGNLEKVRIASLSVGSKVMTTFQNRLDDYTRITHFQVDLDAEKTKIDELRSAMEPYDIWIIGLHDNSVRPLNRNIYSDSLSEFIESVVSDKRSISVSFRNPYTLNQSFFQNAGTVVAAYADSDIAQDLAAQALFGGIGFSGRLPVSINESWREGTGLDREGGLRLSYTIPEELGISSEILSDSISFIMDQAIDSMAFPGGQVLLAKDGKVFYHETFGFHTYDRNREVKKDDLYDFASVTKVTGPLPALMMLHDRQLFRLDNTLGDDFPYMKRSNKGKIQWRPILAHHARLQAWIPYWTTAIKDNGKFRRNTLSYDYSDKYSIQLKEGLYLHNDYRSKIYKMIRKSPLREEAGYLYSGLSFYLYPEIISQKTGQDYHDFLKENIYRPLGAYTLTYNPADEFELGRLVPTENDTFFRKMQIRGVVHDEGAAMMNGISGNAGLFGTANDLAKLMQMYQNMGSYGGEQMISEYTLRKFTSCQYCEEGNHRGLGFDKPLIENRENGTPAPSASLSSFGHSGYTGTFTWADPESGILFVFFSNRVYPTRLNRKLYTMNIRPRIHQLVYELAGED